MRLLLASVRRHVFRGWGTWVAVPVLVCLAVAIYGGTYMGLNRIADSTDQLYDELSMFDLEVRIRPSTRLAVPRETELVEGVDGVSRATWRARARGTLTLDDGSRTAAAVLTLLPGRHPDVADVKVTSGEWLRKDRPRHVVLDKTWAEDHGIAVGDAVDLRIEGMRVDATVGGIGVFPEFLLSSVDEHFSVPVRGSLVAVSVSEGLLFRKLMGRVPINDLVVTLDPGADPEDVQNRLLETLQTVGLEVTKVVHRDAQYSVVCNRNRLTTFRDFLPTTIVLFDGLAALIAILTIRRLVADWRRAAGTLLTFGVRRRHVMLAWVAAIASLIAMGVVAGVAGAFVLANVVASLYVEITGFPILSAPLHPGPLVEAAALASLLLPLGCLPVFAGHLPTPVALLAANVSNPATFTLRLPVSLPAAEELGVRSALRRPGVALVTVVSIAGTLVMSASLVVFGDAQWRNQEAFVRSRHWDATVHLRASESAPALVRRFEALGFRAVEPLVVGRLTLRHGSASVPLLPVVGGPWNSDLQGEEWLIAGRSLSGSDRPEVLLGYRQARALGVWAGEPVTAAGPAGEAELEVVGVLNAFMMDQAFVSSATLSRLAGPSEPNGALLAGPADAVRGLLGDPAVALVLDGDQITEASLASTAGFVTLVRIYGALGVAAGFVVLVSALGTSLRDREAELAALRCQGVTSGFILRVVAAEAAVLACVGGGLSLPFVRWTCSIFQERIARTGMFVPLENDALLVGLSLVSPLVLVALAVVPLGRRVLRRPLTRSLSARWSV